MTRRIPSRPCRHGHCYIDRRWPKRSSSTKTGGPEELGWRPCPVPSPGRARRGSARPRSASTSSTSTSAPGLYKAPGAAVHAGQEGAGVVEAVGPGVTEVAVGDRVAYAGVPGAYAEMRIICRRARSGAAARRRSTTARPPAMMLKGMTAQYPAAALRARSKRGDTILFHAAAGGVGSIACQWAQAPRRQASSGPPAGPRRSRARRRHGCDARHRLPAGGLRRPRQGADRRRGRAGGLRLRGQGDLRARRSTACARAA